MSRVTKATNGVTFTYEDVDELLAKGAIDQQMAELLSCFVVDDQRSDINVSVVSGVVNSQPNFEPTSDGRAQARFTVRAVQYRNGRALAAFPRVTALEEMAESLEDQDLAKGERVKVDGPMHTALFKVVVDKETIRYKDSGRPVRRQGSWIEANDVKVGSDAEESSRVTFTYEDIDELLGEGAIDQQMAELLSCFVVDDQRSDINVSVVSGVVSNQPNFDPTSDGRPQARCTVRTVEYRDGQALAEYPRVTALEEMAESLEDQDLAKGERVKVDGPIQTGLFKVVVDKETIRYKDSGKPVTRRAAWIEANDVSVGSDAESEGEQPEAEDAPTKKRGLRRLPRLRRQRGSSGS